MIGSIPLGAPMLGPKAPAERGALRLRFGETGATRRDALRATAVCAGLFVLTYAVLWALFYPALANGEKQIVAAVRNAAVASGVAAFGMAFATAYKPRLTRLTAPATATLGGAFAGGLALAFEQRYPGIAMQSIGVTTRARAVLIGGYTTGLINVTARFRAAAMAGAATIAVVYLARLLLLLLDMRLPVIHGGGWGAVLWTGFIALIASLNFAVDLERIDKIEDRQMPAVGAWYVALATTTFVWLYISILRRVARARGA